MADIPGPSNFCVTNLTDLSEGEKKQVDDIVNQFYEEARQRVDNPDSNSSKVEEVFQSLLERRRNQELSRALRRRVQARSLIEARARQRRIFDSLMQQQRLMNGVSPHTPHTAMAEVLNRVGGEVERRADRAFQGFLNEIDNSENGLAGFFLDPSNEIDILTELGERNKSDGQPGITGSRQAQEIADLFQTYIDSDRNILADHGLKIQDLEGRMIKNTLTPQTVRQVSQSQFVEDFLPRIDRRKMFEDENISDTEVRRELAEIYDRIIRGEERDVPLSQRGSGQTESRFADKIVQPREIHLRTAEDVQFMARNYGPGNVRSAMLESLRTNARNAAIIDEMGPDPRNTLDALKEHAKSQTDDADEARLIDEPTAKETILGRNLDAIMDTIDGTSMQGNTTVMRDLGIIMRNVSSFAFLGKLLFASVPDVGTFRRAQSRVGMKVGGQGRALLDEMFSGSRLTEEQQRRALGHIGTASRFQVHDLYEMSGNSTFTGRLANRSQFLGHFTFKYSGGQFWQRSMQRAAQAMWSSHMADEVATKNFADLENEMQKILRRSGIGEEEWGQLQRIRDRIIAEDPHDGNTLLLPEAIDEIDDATIRSEILGDMNATDRTVRQARRDLTSKVQSSTFTFTGEAVIRPDARARSALAGGTQAGSLTGFLLRMMTNLMSWPYAFTMRALGAEVDKGSRAAQIQGVGALTGTMLAYAGLGVAAQDLFVENKTRDWFSDDPEVLQKNFFDVASRAGLGGLYGGWLMSFLRFNQPPFSSFGPASNLVGDITSEVMSMPEAITEGEIDELLARNVRLFDSVTPDLPLLQPIFQHGAFNWAENVINPGFTPPTEETGSSQFIGGN